MARWLRRAPAGHSPHDGHLGLIQRWLRVYGPGTETDIVWWLGSTKTAVRKALAELGAIEVDLDDGQTGYVLPDDVTTDEPEPDDDAVILLPEWTRRRWAISTATSTSATCRASCSTQRQRRHHRVVRGRVVGGWRPDGDKGIELVLCEKVPARVERALRERGEELINGAPLDRPARHLPRSGAAGRVRPLHRSQRSPS